MKRFAPFEDRQDAGRRLAAALERHRADAPVVLTLLRDGVPGGFEAAETVKAPERSHSAHPPCCHFSKPISAVTIEIDPLRKSL